MYFCIFCDLLSLMIPQTSSYHHLDLIRRSNCNCSDARPRSLFTWWSCVNLSDTSIRFSKPSRISCPGQYFFELINCLGQARYYTFNRIYTHYYSSFVGFVNPLCQPSSNIWKVAKVFPIFTNENLNDLVNHRPPCLLPYCWNSAVTYLHISLYTYESSETSNLKVEDVLK